MIPGRIAFRRGARPIAVALAIALGSVAACGSDHKGSEPWPELGGDTGGGSYGGGLGTTVGKHPPSSSTSSTSSTSSAGGGGSGPSSEGGGGAGGAPCVDPGPGEPNDTEATATFLGNITDCDSTGKSVSGVLKDQNDVDWYRYTAADTFGCTVDPTRSLAPPGIGRLCKFARCTNGHTAAVTCQTGASATMSPSGLPGCCSTRGFSMDVSCGGNDDASIFLRVDEAATACASYTILFHY